MNCLHPKTRLLKVDQVTEYTDRERVFYRECISCGQKITSIELQIPDGMAPIVALNLAANLLAETKTDSDLIENEGTKPTLDEIKIARKHSDSEFRERVCSE